MSGPEWGDPIEYDPADTSSPEQDIAEHHKARIERERAEHLDYVLWNHFAGHYGRDGNLVIPIRFRED